MPWGFRGTENACLGSTRLLCTHSYDLCVSASACGNGGFIWFYVLSAWSWIQLNFESLHKSWEMIGYDVMLKVTTHYVWSASEMFSTGSDALVPWVHLEDCKPPGGRTLLQEVFHCGWALRFTLTSCSSRASWVVGVQPAASHFSCHAFLAMMNCIL